MVHDRSMVVHQCLHGYSAGHRLLKSSKRLPRAAERALLVLSDLSGPSAPSGFSSYISAYPVPESDSYALARTWIAPEMDRPGCVWTHTLLVGLEDLAAIENPYYLNSLFRRPDGGEHGYDKPIELALDTARFSELPQDSTNRQVAEVCVVSLYGSADRSVLLSAEESRATEPFVFGLWRQQWPSLRVSFRFCTGSLSNRVTDGVPFDLQVVPASRSRQIQREAQNAIVIDAKTGIRQDDSLQAWIDVIVDDLYEPTGTTFGSFLQQYAVDIGPQRHRMCAMAKVFASVEGLRVGGRANHPQSGLSHLIEEIANNLPEPSDGRFLKRALFHGEGLPLVPALDTMSNEVWLQAILNAKTETKADCSFLNVEERAQGLWHENRRAALTIAATVSGSTRTLLQERFLCSLAMLCNGDDLLEAGSGDLSAVEAFVRCRPDLAVSLTRGTVEVQRAALRGLFASGEDTSTRDPMLQFITSSDCSDVVSDALQHLGCELVDEGLSFLLSSYLNNGSLSLGRAWSGELRKATGAVLSWFDRSREKAGAASYVVMSRALDPHSPLLDGVGYGTWRAFFELPESAVDPDRRIEVLAFMLVRAYSSLESEAADLAVRCFGPVHEKASRARLTDFAWRMLSDDLPVLPHYQNWDVCERLRRGLIQNFIIHRWSVRLFFLASRDPITFDRLLESCSSVSGGSDFIDSLERSASGHDSNASLGQREAIKKKQSWLSWLL